MIESSDTLLQVGTQFQSFLFKVPADHPEKPSLGMTVFDQWTGEPRVLRDVLNSPKGYGDYGAGVNTKFCSLEYVPIGTERYGFGVLDWRMGYYQGLPGGVVRVGCGESLDVAGIIAVGCQLKTCDSGAIYVAGSRGDLPAGHADIADCTLIGPGKGQRFKAWCGRTDWGNYGLMFDDDSSNTACRCYIDGYKAGSISASGVNRFEDVVYGPNLKYHHIAWGGGVSHFYGGNIDPAKIKILNGSKVWVDGVLITEGATY